MRTYMTFFADFPKLSSQPLRLSQYSTPTLYTILLDYSLNRFYLVCEPSNIGLFPGKSAKTSNQHKI